MKKLGIMCSLCLFIVVSYGYGGGIIFHDGKLNITNCTIANNEAGSSSASARNSGGIGFSSGPVATITNSILWGNKSSVVDSKVTWSTDCH